MSVNCKTNSFAIFENRIKRFTKYFFGNQWKKHPLSESEVLLLMVLNLFYNVMNAVGDIRATYEYRFTYQTACIRAAQRFFCSPKDDDKNTAMCGKIHYRKLHNHSRSWVSKIHNCSGISLSCRRKHH